VANTVEISVLMKQQRDIVCLVGAATPVFTDIRLSAGDRNDYCIEKPLKGPSISWHAYSTKLWLYFLIGYNAYNNRMSLEDWNCYLWKSRTRM